ncbi:MAG: pirin family protein [Bacteroidota bacterium]
MSNTDLIIEERPRDIGDFLVGRLLPFRKKRMVGPFIFVDHMGPSVIKPGSYFDIGQHPHIGLSTLTYLFDGEIMHQDSLGTIQRVTAGSVGWMTAGKGIVHTERTPDDHRDGGSYPIHGFQIWVALPEHLEKMEPQFSYTDAKDVPSWSENGNSFKLIAGKGFGRQSPVPVYSDLFLLEINVDETTEFDIKDNLQGEIGICVVDGSIDACGQIVEKGSLLVSKEENACKLMVNAKSKLLIFGGQSFAEERFIDWNFVATDKEIIREARENWHNKKFKMIPGDPSYIPLPSMAR